MSVPTVHTMYWENIPTNILAQQRAVFAHLGIPLQQHLADKMPHGSWMNQILENASSDDTIVFCDIDAFPLQRSAYLQALEHAEAGRLFGLGQFSNHKPGNDVYAGPMFMALKKRLWEQIGTPGLRSSKFHDAAEVMTALARQHDIPVQLIYPSGCLIPKYSLGNEGIFGIATFYGKNEFFHLFESREPAYEALLDAVAQDVVQDRPLNFNHYLVLAQTLQGRQPAPKKKWWKIL